MKRVFERLLLASAIIIMTLCLILSIQYLSKLTMSKPKEVEPSKQVKKAWPQLIHIFY